MLPGAGYQKRFGNGLIAIRKLTVLPFRVNRSTVPGIVLTESASLRRPQATDQDWGLIFWEEKDSANVAGV